LFQGLGAPDVRRRFPKKNDNQKDKAARQAALVLERGLSYSIDAYDCEAQIEASVEDCLLPGRGTGWIVYDAEVTEYEEDAQDDDADADNENLDSGLLTQTNGAEDPAMNGGMGGLNGAQALDEAEVPAGPEITQQSVKIDHVYFKDFLTSAGRKWSDTWWCARGHDYSRDELHRYFPTHAAKVPLDVSIAGFEDSGGKSRNNRESDEDTFRRARVWEIWDKSKKRRIYIAEGYGLVLKDDEDPYKLKDFYPTVEPLYGVKTTSSLQPIPEYCMYQDQAEELDIITTRIARLIDALKRRGVYDASAEGSDNSLSQLAYAGDNEFLPYKNFSVLLEKGGLANVFMTEDLKPIIEVIDKLQQHRITLVQTIYEITGISDIIRGASDPNETATAQRIKGQFGSLRLQKRQKRIQTYIRDLFRLKAEIMAEHFTREMLQEMTSIDMPLKAEQDAAKQKLIAMSLQEQLAKALQAQSQAPPPGPPGATPPQAPAAGPGGAPGAGPPGAMPGAGGGGAPAPGPQMHAMGMPVPPGPPPPSPPPGGNGMGVMGPGMGGPPPIPPPDPKAKEQLMAIVKAVSWEEISDILRSDQRRGYRVDIQTDSLTQVNDEQEKKQRIEFLSVMQKFAETSIPGIMQFPAMAPFAKEMASFVLGAFKVGRTLEEVVDDTFSQLEQMAQAALAGGPKQDPEEKKIELEAKAKMMELQFKEKEGALNMQLKDKEMQHDARLKEMEFQHKAKLAEMEMQQELQLKQREMDLQLHMKEREMNQNMQLKEREFGFKAQEMEQQAALKEREFGMQVEQHHNTMGLEREKMGMAREQHGEKMNLDREKHYGTMVSTAQKLATDQATAEGEQANNAQSTDNMRQLIERMQAALQEQSQLMSAAIQQMGAPRRLMRDPRTGEKRVEIMQQQ